MSAGAAGDAAQALLMQILFFIRSERQLVEAIIYDLLYRWFVVRCTRVS